MKPSEDRLSAALRDWRSADRGEDRLSATSRARILEAARSPAGADRIRTFDSLFLPLRGWALAGALPVALLTLALGYGLWPRQAVEPDSGPILRASRVGHEVVFEIANGGKPHRVSRYERMGAPGEAVAVRGGRFRDRLDAGGNLVFYRID